MRSPFKNAYYQNQEFGKISIPLHQSRMKIMFKIFYIIEIRTLSYRKAYTYLFTCTHNALQFNTFDSFGVLNNHKISSFRSNQPNQCHANKLSIFSMNLMHSLYTHIYVTKYVCILAKVWECERTSSLLLLASQ